MRLLIGLGGQLHPRVDTALEYEQGLAGMFADSTWAPAHALTLGGFVLLATSLAVLVANLGAVSSPRVRTAGWVAVGAAGIAVVELVPHLLAKSEATAVVDGAATPLTDLHSLLQAVSTPAVGLSLAALAVLSAPNRALGSGRIAAAVAVLGGLTFAAAGPAIAITEDPAFSPLFAGAAGLAIWLVVSGVRSARLVAA